MTLIKIRTTSLQSCRSVDRYEFGGSQQLIPFQASVDKLKTGLSKKSASVKSLQKELQAAQLESGKSQESLPINNSC